MDIFRQLFEATLDIECPHCGHLEPDDLEVTTPNVVARTQCQNCERCFHFALLECGACDDEFIVICTEREAAVSRLFTVCSMCQQQGAHHEDFDSEILGLAQTQALATDPDTRSRPVHQQQL